MEGNQDVECGEKRKVSTLVFMDLETTGLPSEIGARNVNITEISLIAIDRNNFEVDKALRVLNKISLCVRPRSVISPVCMNLTGLYNDILESQEEFDDTIPKLLEYFFRRLQKPICLLAHNGNRFDFPVLQAELNRLNYSLSLDIVCADTLVGFREIRNMQKQEVGKKAKEEEIVKCYENVHISEDDVDKLLSDDIEQFSQMVAQLDDPLESNLIEISPYENKSLLSKDINNKDDLVPEESKSSIDVLSPIQNETTPKKNGISVQSSQNCKVPRKRKVLDPTFLPKYQYKKRVVNAKRNLFPDSTKRNLCPDPPPEIHNLTKFSLSYLYNYFFNEDPPNSHFAETDSISLSKVCQIIHKDFLHWVDENNVAFSTIDPLW